MGEVPCNTLAGGARAPSSPGSVEGRGVSPWRLGGAGTGALTACGKGLGSTWQLTGAESGRPAVHRRSSGAALQSPAMHAGWAGERWQRLSRRGFHKVPELTLLFWVIKLCSTAMGESTSDYVVFHINPYVAVVVGCVGLLVALALQLRAPRYRAWIYWLAVVMVAVFGTMVADVLHVVLGIPYLVTSVSLALALVLVFLAWYGSERTLSIHSIVTPRRELFYWATVMATFALGTALGDLTAATLGLGYLASALLFAVLFVIPAIGYRWFGWDAIAAFWSSYVITRPLGASVADWLGKPFLGGLGIGDGRVAIGLTLLIVILVAYLATTRPDLPVEEPLRGVVDVAGPPSLP